MRLGGPVFFSGEPSPEAWVAALQSAGYSAALCPPVDLQDTDAIEAYKEAAASENILIAEVGAWSNPLSADESERGRALALCKERLSLADKLGARCCVNISGARGGKWDGPHPENLTGETFDMIVSSVREIIDAVRPENTFYTLEPMPWMYPDSADSYLALIEAVDRERFAVHMDPVNLVNSPEKYFRNGDLIRECFRKLGGRIKSCHAKDIFLSDRLYTHLEEAAPGKGGLDYECYLREIDATDADMPLVLEHLETREEYAEAACLIRSKAEAAGVGIINPQGKP